MNRPGPGHAPGPPTETTAVNKQKAVQQYQDIYNPHPFAQPTDEQVMIARVGVDQLHRQPEPEPLGPDPRQALAQIQLPDEPLVPQAERIDGPNLARAQRRRERLIERRRKVAEVKVDPLKVTLGDVVAFLVAVGLAIGAILVLAGFAAGIERWPALWGGA